MPTETTNDQVSKGEPRQDDVAGGGRPAKAAKVWSLLLVAAFVAGFVLVSSVVVVRGRLLDDGLYTGALARNDAYDRVYTEVLADPELVEVTEQLLGGLDVEALDPTQVRALTTSALRWSVPPATLQRGTEAAIAAVLAYVRGDTDRLDPDVDVSEVLERIAGAAVTWVDTLLATTAERVTTAVDDYRAAVASYLDRLASGAVPDAVPVLGGATVDRGPVVDMVLDQLGPDVDPAVRSQVEAAILAGDERGALIAATRDLVAERSADAVADLRASLEDGRQLDVVTELADRAGRSRATVIDRLDLVRDAARWFGPATAIAGVVLMVAAAAGLVWLHRRRPRRAGFLVAGAAVLSGLTLLVLWTVVIALVEAPLAPATETGPGSWRLPAGLRSLLGDVVSTLDDELSRTVLRLVVVPMAVGVALAAGIVAADRLGRPSPTRAVAVGAVASVVVGVATWSTPVLAAPDEPQACNGAAELCDRRYDEVVHAATHNSMSSPDVVFVWPEHDGDIRSQLDHGVRALLIDTHHWTSLTSAEQLAAGDPRLPADLAERTFERLASRREARDGTYLCHNQCALGAIPLVEALGSVREFLEENPHEVVTLIIQDAISPEETADAFTRAGLDRYLHRHEPGTTWATLGELISDGERLVVFAEEEGPPPAWYHQAFEHIQETPYLFAEPEDFTCDPNRGDPEATLFLMNHWVQRVAPDRADAVTVNAHDAIVDRAEQCQRERGLLPNFVAVNFYSIGSLTDAVATLNGVDDRDDPD